jgi:hypothetical protein
MAEPNPDHVEVDRDNIPDGMKIFKNLNHEIRDSTNSYRQPGELCLLDKKLATHYYKLNMVQPEMPDFDEQFEGKSDASGKSSDSASTETAPAAGGDKGKAKP